MEQFNGESMSRFLRIGQELTKIYVEGRDIEEFNIVLHTEGDLRSPGVMPATIEKAAKVFQKYVALLTDVTIPIIYDTRQRAVKSTTTLSSL